LINDQLFESCLIAIASLKGKGVELVIDFSGIIQFKDVFGAANDLIKIESCLSDFGYDFGLCGLNDFFGVL